jgi:hypothetical protein
MPDLLDKFEKAAKKISSSEKKDIRKCVYCAYVDHLSDINTDDLPEDIQIFYESIIMRLTSTVPAGKISDDEAHWIAKDILFMADVIRTHNRPQYHTI